MGTLGLKKRICIITSAFPTHKNDSSGFAGVFVRDFALLMSEKYETFVLTPARADSKGDETKFKIKFFPWIRSELGLSALNPKNPIHFFKLISVIISGIFTTIRLIRKNKIDLSIAMWAVPSGLFALIAKKLFGTPYFVWALGSDIWKIQSYPFGKYVLKKILRNAQYLFADGMQLARDVEEISGRKCDFLASNRILDTTHNEVTYPKFELTKINFIFLGRYHPHKGIDLLIEAISQLTPEEKERSLFHIFGGGPLESKIRKMVKDLGLEKNVFVNGIVDGDKVFSYISRSNYVIIPSRIESIPLIVSDAMQANKPVVLTDVGDMGNLVRQFNVGFVIEPTAEGIAKGIREAINCDKKKLESFIPGLRNLRDYLDLKKSEKIITNLIK